MNNFNTLGLPVDNSFQNVKIKSKKIKAQHVPYFFSAIRANKNVSAKSIIRSVKTK